MLIILGKMQIGKVDRLSGKFCSVFVMLVEKKEVKAMQRTGRQNTDA